MSSLYKLLAYASLLLGIVIVLFDLQVFGGEPVSASRPLPTPLLVAAIGHALATAFAVISCLAISEGIRLLLEASDDWHAAARVGAERAPPAG